MIKRHRPATPFLPTRPFNYAQRFKPELMSDMATLTGAVLIGLGKHMAGIMGTDQDAMDALRPFIRSVFDYRVTRSGGD